MQIACELPGVASSPAPGVFSRIWLLVAMVAYVAGFALLLIYQPVIMLAALAGCVAVLGWCWWRAPVVEDIPEVRR